MASAAAYGLMPILGKTAYQAGVGTLPLLAWRYAIAALVFTLLLRGHSQSWGERLRLWALGLVFVINSLAYFLALRTVSASVVALLLYSYPVLVTLLAAVAGLERLTVRSLTTALLTFAGCALTAMGGAESIPLSGAGIGVVFALLSAFVYASFLVLTSRFAAGVPARVLAQHLAQTSALVCAALALASGGLGLPSTPRAWLSVIGIALVSTVFALFTFFAGMALIGPTRASVLSSFEVVVTLLLAFLLLGERLDLRQWAGAFLIVSALVWQNQGALRVLLRGGEERQAG